MIKKVKIILGIIFITIILIVIFATDIFASKLVNAGIKMTSTTASGAPGWYAGYTYRKKISIDHQKVASTTGANITGFPMLVSVTDADLKSTTDWGGKVASTTGGDILFTSANGTTLLDYEIEKYASTTGQLIAWVEIPFLSSTSTTPIYMYLGNASASNTQNPTGVWDSNYKGVWHMNDNAANTTVAESTSNANTGTASANTNTMTASTLPLPGMAFNGARLINSANSVGITGTSWTISFWVNNFVQSGTRRFFGSSSNSTSPCLWRDTVPQVGVVHAGVVDWSSSGTDFPTDLHYITVIQNGTGTNGSKIYKDGVLWLQGTDTYSYTFGTMRIGGGDTTYVEYVNADIGEFRVSDNVRSADWIKTEYNNQAFPSQFYSYGGLENYNGRLNSSGASTPAVKVRGGVKFR